jgi:hypothetical protein
MAEPWASAEADRLREDAVGAFAQSRRRCPVAGIRQSDRRATSLRLAIQVGRLCTANDAGAVMSSVSAVLPLGEQRPAQSIAHALQHWYSINIGPGHHQAGIPMEKGSSVAKTLRSTASPTAGYGTRS